MPENDQETRRLIITRDWRTYGRQPHRHRYFVSIFSCPGHPLIKAFADGLPWLIKYVMMMMMMMMMMIIVVVVVNNIIIIIIIIK